MRGMTGPLGVWVDWAMHEHEGPMSKNAAQVAPTTNPYTWAERRVKLKIQSITDS
jgi:hypothetical protein